MASRARVSLLVAFAALISAVPPIQADAATSIGRVGTGGACSAADFLYFQKNPPPGDTYVVPPGNARVTSWSHQANSNPAGTVGFIVVRKVADPSAYMVVGHDGPRPMTPSALNTFPVDIPVQPGDIIGVSAGNATGPNPNGCFLGSPTTGFNFYYHPGALADGIPGPFTESNDAVINVAATVEPSAAPPSNRFTIGKAAKNKKKGTATLTVSLPGPGELTGSGRNVSARTARSSASVAGPGDVTLLIAATGKAKKKLKRKGKVRLAVTVQFTPNGGAPSSQATTVVLKKGIKMAK